MLVLLTYTLTVLVCCCHLVFIRGDSRHGIKGQDAVVHVPPGTIVRDRWGALAGR